MTEGVLSLEASAVRKKTAAHIAPHSELPQRPGESIGLAILGETCKGPHPVHRMPDCHDWGQSQGKPTKTIPSLIDSFMCQALKKYLI